MLALALAALAALPQADLLRPFEYAPAAPFAAGGHRGADFALRPGDAVSAPCGGRIGFAGQTPSGRAITLRCGRWRVSLLPVRAHAALRPGRIVREGDPVGTLDAGHRGLHVGVREAADRFGYVDPLRVLGRARMRPPAPLAPPRGGPRRPSPRAPLALRPRPLPAPTPHRPPPSPLTWPVLVGAALLAAAIPVPVVRLRRRRRRRLAAALEAG